MKNLLKIVERYKSLTETIIDFDKFNTYSIIHHSSVIEGSSLTEGETILLLDENLSPKNKPIEDINLVLDHKKAMLFILNLAENKEKITVKTLQKAAGMIVNYKYGEEPISKPVGIFYPSKGEFRNCGIRAGEQTFMDYQKVPTRVTALIEYINSRIDKVSGFEQVNNLAFDAHFEIVTIHPFADGNGRISRLLMNYIQRYHKSPLTLVLSENKGDYYDALMKTRATEDVTVFRKFMYEQCEKQFTKEINVINNNKDNNKRNGMSFLV